MAETSIAAQVEPTVPAGRFAGLRALRVHQWVKNTLLLVPVVLDHRLFDEAVLSRAFAAFVAFCLAASGAYIVNDLLDLEADHGAACHFAAKALETDVGIAHIDHAPVRRGTPESALAAIRPELMGIDAAEKTVAVDDTSLAEALKVTDVLEAKEGTDSDGGPAGGTPGPDGTTPPPH